MNVNLRNYKHLLGVAFVAVLIIYGMPRAMGIGYITGYQGLQAEFDSVFVKNYWYDSTHKGPNSNYNNFEASATEFFDHINLDPDEATTYLPNLGASQTPVSVDLGYGTTVYQWAVKVTEEVVEGSNATHTWTTTIETFKEFQMIRYKCDWSVNLWLTGDYNEATMTGEAHVWRDAQIWIRLVPQDFVYFEDNPDQVFFSPAKIQLSSIEWWSTDNAGKEDHTSNIAQYQDLFPEARGETLGIFYSRGGADTDLEQTILNFEGILLDPQVFREEYWVRLDLQMFRPFSWWSPYPISWSYEFPSVKLDFEVFVFVVGEWTVQLSSDETLELEPHQPQIVEFNFLGPLLNWINGVVSWFGNPFNLAGLGGTAIAIVVLFFFALILIRAPWILKRLFGGKN